MTFNYQMSHPNYLWEIIYKDESIKGIFVEFDIKQENNISVWYPISKGDCFAFCPFDYITQYNKECRTLKEVPEYILFINRQNIQGLTALQL